MRSEARVRQIIADKLGAENARLKNQLAKLKGQK